MDAKRTARVECQECQFSTVVRAGDDVVPADVVIEHGKASGHELSVTHMAE